MNDTWRKPKRGGIKSERWGWLGWGYRWGKNGENCAFTTIKNKNKNAHTQKDCSYVEADWVHML